MSLVEILRVIGGLLLFFLPGFLLTYLIFRGKETLLERIVIGFSLSISLITLILFGANKLFGLKISLLTCTITIGVITFAIVLALLGSNTIHLKGFLSSFINQRDKLRQYSGLTIILAFTFFMAFIPHLDYVYPLHIDEWFHFGSSQALIEAQGLPFTEPFHAETIVFDHHEIGFFLFLSQIKLLTRLSWINIFLFLPGIIFMLTVLASFIVGQRANFGLEAAFFVTLIPTTARFLGPSFLVPVALGLFFLAVILFLLHCCEMNRAKAVVLFLLLAFLFLFHPPTAIAASLLCVIYGLVILWKSRGGGIARWQTPLLIWGSVFVSSFVCFSRYWGFAVIMAGKIPQPEHYLPLIYDALPKFGFIPLGLFVTGIGFLAYENGNRAWALIASSWALLTIMLSYQMLERGVPILYERAFLYFFLFAGIIAGFATKKLRQWCADLFSRFTRKASLASLLIVFIPVVAAGALGVRSHLEEPYYHLITDSQYNDCLWIREELDSSYERAVVNPRMAIAFSSLSGKSIYASDAAIIFRHPERLKEVDEFLQGNASNISWLIERDIDIVYTELPVNNPKLKELKERVYIVPRELRNETNP